MLSFVRTTPIVFEVFHFIIDKCTRRLFINFFMVLLWIMLLFQVESVEDSVADCLRKLKEMKLEETKQEQIHDCKKRKLVKEKYAFKIFFFFIRFLSV